MYGCNWRARTRRSRVESLRQTLTVWWMAERSLWVLLDTSAAAVGHNQIAQGCLFHNYTTQIALPGGLTYERCSLSSLSSKKLQWNCEKSLRTYRADREGVYGGCSVWNDPSDPTWLAVMIIEIFPILLCPVQFPTVVNSSTVRGQGKVGEEWVGGWVGAAVLFSVLILFPLSLLLPLTLVIYDVHPSSGRVHQLLVARRSWQQLCAARGVGSAVPLLSLGPVLHTHTHKPLPQKNKQKEKVPLLKTLTTFSLCYRTLRWKQMSIKKSNIMCSCWKYC